MQNYQTKILVRSYYTARSYVFRSTPQQLLDYLKSSKLQVLHVVFHQQLPMFLLEELELQQIISNVKLGFQEQHVKQLELVTM